DDGRLTDAQGRTVDFKNTVVIMTSNLGGEVFLNRAGSETEQAGEVMAILRQHFRPEFLNRVDDVVVFHPLRREHIRQIVDVQLKRLAKRLEEKRVTIDLSDAARERLAELGYDPVYGARPLKRVIQREVLDKLALEILQGKIHEGDHVVADVQGGALTFCPEKAAAV
ncbi:MAG TPA: AAA family ATPase, partial [Candidatus Hydrogenedentes bacterium]|nr:AAA family ATPase [Candidatus Hydrogenedentota bacterium]